MALAIIGFTIASAHYYKEKRKTNFWCRFRKLKGLSSHVLIILYHQPVKQACCICPRFKQKPGQLCY
jgi:hypothetical protein